MIQAQNYNKKIGRMAVGEAPDQTIIIDLTEYLMD